MKKYKKTSVIRYIHSSLTSVNSLTKILMTLASTPCLHKWQGHKYISLDMMTSPNGNIFRVTGSLWGNPRSHRKQWGTFSGFFKCDQLPVALWRLYSYAVTQLQPEFVSFLLGRGIVKENDINVLGWPNGLHGIMYSVKHDHDHYVVLIPMIKMFLMILLPMPYHGQLNTSLT